MTPERAPITPDGPAPRLFRGLLIGLALAITFFWAPLIWVVSR